MATNLETPDDIQRFRDQGLRVVVMDGGDWHHFHGGASGWVGHDRSWIMISLAEGLQRTGSSDSFYFATRRS